MAAVAIDFFPEREESPPGADAYDMLKIWWNQHTEIPYEQPEETPSDLKTIDWPDVIRAALEYAKTFTQEQLFIVALENTLSELEPIGI